MDTCGHIKYLGHWFFVGHWTDCPVQPMSTSMSMSIDNTGDNKGRIATLRHHVIDQSKCEITCHMRRMKKLKNKNKKRKIAYNVKFY